MINKQSCFIAAVVLTFLVINTILYQDFPLHGRPPIADNIDHVQWSALPTMELAVRMNSNPAAVTVYKKWFVRSLQLFWPEEWLNLTVILDDESTLDHVL